MKKPKFSESKIFQILKEANSGVPVPELCRKYGMSSASFYNWRSKFGGMDVSNMTRAEAATLAEIIALFNVFDETRVGI